MPVRGKFGNAGCSVVAVEGIGLDVIQALKPDAGYDAGWIRELARRQGARANIPPQRNRKDPICFGPHLIARAT